MAEEFSIEQQRAKLMSEVETLQAEVVERQRQLDEKLSRQPDFNARQNRQEINRVGELADAKLREIDILRGLQAQIGIAEQQGRSVSPEAQQKFFETRSEQIRQGILQEFSRQREIKAQRGRLQESVTFRELPPEKITGAKEFLEERQVDTFKPGRFDDPIPVTKIFVVTQAGDIIRDASASERKEFKSKTSVLRESVEREPRFFKEGLPLRESLERAGKISLGIAPVDVTPSEMRSIEGASIFGAVVLGLTPVGRIVKTPTIIGFKGTTSEVFGGKQIITQTRFKTSVGEIGQATSVSKIGLQKGKISIVDTKTIGASGRKVVGFEKVGELGISPKQAFIVGEKSKIFTMGKASISKGSGKVISDKIKTFGTTDIGITRGKKTFSGGVTAFEGGDVTFGLGITSPKVVSGILGKGKVDKISFGKSLDEQFMLGTDRLRVTGKKRKFQELTIPKSDLKLLLKEAQIKTESGVRAGITTPKIPISQMGIMGAVGLSFFQIGKIKQTIETPTQTTKLGITKQQSIQSPRFMQQERQTGRLGITQQQLPLLRSTPRLAQQQRLTQKAQQKIIQSPRFSLRPRQTGRGRGLLRVGIPTARTPPRIPVLFPTLKFKKKEKKKLLLPTAFVEVKKRGKFQLLGKGLTKQKAIILGKEKVSKTLSAQFRVGGGKGLLFTPKGFIAKPGGRFIEKKELRLNTPGEIRSIQTAKRRKKRR